MTNETTASQPKSIGDDAQFQARLADLYSARDESIELGISAPDDRAIAKLISCIDNFRAPADQASATIQAAPEGVKYEADDGTVCARRDGKQLWHAHIYSNGDDEAESEIAKQVVAALAAPMVADPACVAGDYAAKAVHWFSCLDECAKLLGLAADEPIPSGVVKAVRALVDPLVARPAGVADFEVWAKASGYPTFKPNNGNYAGNTWHAHQGWLAATVKAVPSEALDADCPSCDASTRFICHRCKGRGKIAAPLANKTDGGE